MPAGYVVKPLHPDQIDQAYPLIQLVKGSISAIEWRTMAHRYLCAESSSGISGGEDRRESGIISLQTDVGHLLGLFCFSVEPDIARRRTLHVSNFIVLTPFHTEAAAHLLSQEIDRIGRRFGCTSIHEGPLGSISRTT